MTLHVWLVGRTGHTQGHQGGRRDQNARIARTRTFQCKGEIMHWKSSLQYSTATLCTGVADDGQRSGLKESAGRRVSDQC